MQLENSTFYVASVVIVNNPLTYIVSTNAGVSIYHAYDDLPLMVKHYILQYNERSCCVSNSVCVICKVV